MIQSVSGFYLVYRAEEKKNIATQHYIVAWRKYLCGTTVELRYYTILIVE